jgi:integrase
MKDMFDVAERFKEKSSCTKNRYMDTLRAIINFGCELELVTKNPLNKWKKNKERPRDVQLTVQDLKKIYTLAPDHLKWIIEVEWELGTRPGRTELFNLKWSDVDFDNETIHVRGTKTLTSNRIIPLTQHFKERLLEMQERSTTEYIVEYKGKPVTTNVKRSFRQTVGRAGITYPIRLYDIRHLFATTMLTNGGDLKAVSGLLGHSSTRMTADIYYHELKGEKVRSLTCKPVLMV